MAVRGRSPSGSGLAVPPLPLSEWEAVSDPLQRLLDRTRSLVGEMAPEEMEAFEQPQSLDRTRSWIALLLGRAGELFQDLEPAVIARRFGEMSPDETDLLAQRSDGVEAAWREAVDIFDASRYGQPIAGDPASSGERGSVDGARTQ